MKNIKRINASTQEVCAYIKKYANRFGNFPTSHEITLFEIKTGKVVDENTFNKIYVDILKGA